MHMIVHEHVHVHHIYTYIHVHEYTCIYSMVLHHATAPLNVQYRAPQPRYVLYIVSMMNTSALSQHGACVHEQSVHCIRCPHSPMQNAPLHPPLFGGLLEEVMELQAETHPGLTVPWVVTALCDVVLSLKGPQTQRIFR